MAEDDLQEPIAPDEPFEVVDPVDPGMMTFGVVGYVSIEEANQYVLEHYMSSDTLRLSWEALEDADKAVLLRRSFQSIESLPFTGHKTDPDQTTAFPRCPSTSIPLAIKSAQIEQALIGADAEASEDSKHYEKLWQWGVSSYTIGKLHESLSTGTYGAGALRMAGISSPVASRLLAPFMQGGYNIR